MTDHRDRDTLPPAADLAEELERELKWNHVLRTLLARADARASAAMERSLKYQRELALLRARVHGTCDKCHAASDTIPAPAPEPT